MTAPEPAPDRSAPHDGTVGLFGPRIAAGGLLALGVVLTGQQRFMFGVPQLLNGLDVVVVAVGLFAVGEMFREMGEPAAAPDIPAPSSASVDPALLGAIGARHGTIITGPPPER